MKINNLDIFFSLMQINLECICAFSWLYTIYRRSENHAILEELNSPVSPTQQLNYLIDQIDLQVQVLSSDNHVDTSQVVS